MMTSADAKALACSGQGLRPIVGDIRKAMICALDGEEAAILRLREQVDTVARRLRDAPHLKPAA
jgi:hypothetical protein